MTNYAPSSKFNNQAQNNVNTNSVPMYNEDMCLKSTFLNDSISLSFIAAVPREDGSRSFPKENGIWCVIKLEYAVLLHNWLRQYFIPNALANYEKQKADPTVDLKPVIIGIPLNKENTNMLVFKYDKPDANGVMVPVVTFHSGIGMNRIPERSITYKFGTKKIFTQYDEHTGDYEINEDQVQFWVFLKMLEHFIDASTMAEVHANRLGNSYVNKEMRNLIRQIAQKNGIATTTYTNGFDSAPQQNVTPALNTNVNANVAGATTVGEMFAVPGEDLPF